ncbi:MAG: AMP-binding protein [Acidobacteriota bacterium]|nr:AMP-binding protein [Acidobacteriota bacterium]
MLDFETGQLDQLNHLLGELVPGNAFYQAKIEAAGCGYRFESLDDFRTAFPTTVKSELIADQIAHAPYGTNLTYDLKRYVRFNRTSGTSGNPMRWLDTPESWSWMVDNWVKVFQAAGTAEGDRILFAFSFGPFLGFWTAFEAAGRLGALALPAGGMSSLARLRMIHDNQATVLCCTPTYALRLGEAALDHHDLDLHSVKTLIVAGEPGAGIPETRRQIEALWPGARLVDHHGMTEVGPVSYGLPENPDILRIIETAYIAEVVDPKTGRAVGPGHEGELLLTTLGRVGSPLLRYRTGDLVRPWAEAPVGMGPYYLDGGILGRIDDMILVRGVNIYPASVESVIRRFSEIAEFRVHVRTVRRMSELSIVIEPGGECDNPDDLCRRLQEELKSAFALRIPVSLTEEGSLPRFEMKARRWIRD